MMENIFSLKRFWLLVRKHANESWKTFLIALLLFNIPALITYLVSSKIHITPSFHFYMILMILVGGFYTVSFFKDLKHRTRAASLLTLPATAFEKIALVIFYAVIIYIPVFTAVFWGSHFILVKIFDPYAPYMISEFNDVPPLFVIIFYVLLPYTLFQSLFLLFSIWLKKRPFVLTLELCVILFFILSFWNVHYIQWLTGCRWIQNLSQISIFPITVHYFENGQDFLMTSQLIKNVSLMFYATITVLFYVAAYFKLKEKEI